MDFLGHWNPELICTVAIGPHFVRYILIVVLSTVCS